MLIFSFSRLKVITSFWELFFMQGCSKVFLHNPTLGKTKAYGENFCRIPEALLTEAVECPSYTSVLSTMTFRFREKKNLFKIGFPFHISK